jgi:hypothetical protein
MKIVFTNHAKNKMRHYGISESRVKQTVRYPERTEEGVVEETVAAMRLIGSRKDKEVWTMYVPNNEKDEKGVRGRGVRVITAWIYPGTSPERDPVPQKVLEEVREALSLW